MLMNSENVKLANHYLMMQFGGSKREKKWSTLIHNGVMFAPLYVPHNIPIEYNGKEIELPQLAEEYITMYAKYLNTEYSNNKIFHTNFFKSWKPTIKGLGIEKLEDCDLSKIVAYLDKVQNDKKNMSLEEKQIIKDKNLLEEEKYKIAIVDGKEQAIGNYKIEPPGIFLGRGKHPKLGMIKTRIEPRDVTINISKGAPTPELPPMYIGHKYKKIVHNHNAQWLASWKDNISGKTKYVWLGNQSDFKARSDQEKFDLARKLGKNIDKIRSKNLKNMVHNDKKTVQLATALYFIDNFALRVGNEKYDDEADTVGVTSLRCEHVILKDDLNVKLDFLGKDSVRYVNQVQIDEQVYENLKMLMNDKDAKDDVFDLITPNELNLYIKDFMHDLTTKVFRTYNASKLFQDEIDKINKDEVKNSKKDIGNLIVKFNLANAKVAKLCNHQKNISKNYDDDMKKINNKISDYKNKIKELKDKDSKKYKEKIEKLNDQIKKYKIKKEAKSELKNISLGTSKTNYIDPRISIAFLKLHNIPVERVFSKTLREKFFWAFDIEENYNFNI